MPSATPPDPAPLTGAEQAVLAAIATHEHRADSRFADAMAAGVALRRAHVPGALLVVAAVAVVVVGAMILSTAWLLAVAAVALLVVVPTGLVIWALRQDR